MINDAAQKALVRFDETMRELALARYKEFEQRLEPALTAFAVSETIRLMRNAGKLSWPSNVNEVAEVKAITERLTASYGHWLARNPALEDLSQLSRDIVQELKGTGALADEADALELKLPWYRQLVQIAEEAGGADRLTFADELLHSVEAKRLALWRDYREKVNWELLDYGTPTLLGTLWKSLSAPLSVPGSLNPPVAAKNRSDLPQRLSKFD